MAFFNPQPKTKHKKVRKDWTGFAVPKQEVRLEGYEYEKFKKTIIKEDNYTCWKCKRPYHPAELTLHHKIKRSILRLDIRSNVETVCIYCHIEER